VNDESAPPRWEAFFDTHRHDLRRGVAWLLVGRIVIAVACIALVLLLDRGTPKNFPAYVILLVTASVAAGNLLVFHYRLVQNIELFVQLQIVFDVLVETLLVYTTGGVYQMGFAYLYFASILSASLLVSERSGLVVASIATVALALVALAYAVFGNYGMTPPLVSPELLKYVDFGWNTVVTTLVQAGVGFHLVAGLAALLPYRMTPVRLLYDEILDSMREGLVAIDSAGRIVFVNREARRLLNWEALGRLEGRRFIDVLRRREDAKVLEFLTSEEDLHEEVELELRGRGIFAMEVKTTVLRDTRGRIRGVIGVFVDATLQRRVTEMETRIARLAGTEEMALGIAHEIRNPLASIRGAVQELVRAGDASWTDDDRKLASVVQRESDRLDKIVGEFLDFARNRPPELHAQDVGRLVDEIVLLLTQREDAKSFEVKSEVAGGPFVAFVDAGQLRQVILNVGINALEAMKRQDSNTPPPGRPRPGRLLFLVRGGELPARSTLPGGGSQVAARPSVEILIDDDGPGIPQDLRSKVFIPFFTTKKTGLGLGLAIVQKIVKDHGGDIRCESSPSGGARFRVGLPLAEDPRGRTPGGSYPRQAGSTTGARTPGGSYSRPTAASSER
jgi:two-component system sensor histidine kinase PilS (NtrC family)